MQSKRRLIPHLTFAIVATMVTACSNGYGYGGGGMTDVSGTPSATVSVEDNHFSPTAVTIGAGQFVRFAWVGQNAHNVTFDDASIGNSSTQTSGTFDKTFANAGTYTFYCSVHGKVVMSGTVTVR